MIKTTPGTDALRDQFDTIIFDMDGVLLDITESIRVVNCLAVPMYLREVLHWPAPDNLVTTEDIEAFKHAGGFNDDIELTRAIVLHYVNKEHEHPGADPDTLNVFRPTLIDFARKIGERGGGLQNAENICLEKHNYDNRAQVLLDYRTREIGQIFEELFAGEHTQELYGYESKFYKGPGYVNKDKPIIDIAKLPAGKKYGVLTGRTPAEAKLGLKMSGLLEIVPESNLMTPKGGPRKPDPRGLRKLVEEMGAQRTLYIGDTLDDYRTVERYQRKYADLPVSAALVLTGPAGVRNKKIFERSGAEIAGADVNEILDWLSGTPAVEETDTNE